MDRTHKDSPNYVARDVCDKERHGELANRTQPTRRNVQESGDYRRMKLIRLTSSKDRPVLVNTDNICSLQASPTDVKDAQPNGTVVDFGHGSTQYFKENIETVLGKATNLDADAVRKLLS